MQKLGLVYKGHVKPSKAVYYKYIRVIVIALIFWGIFWTQLDLAGVLAMSRNTSRQNHVNQIMDAITSYQTDGQFSDVMDSIPGCEEPTEIGTSKNLIDLYSILGSLYLVKMPLDPLEGTVENTGYDICYTDHNRIKVEAIYVEGDHRIAVIR